MKISTKHKMKKVSGKPMTAILAICLACSLILGRTTWAEGERIENSAIQVFYYADEKGIELSFAPDLIIPPDPDAAYGDEGSEEEQQIVTDYQIQVAQNQSMTKHLMTKKVSELLLGTPGLPHKPLIKELTPGEMPPGKTYYVRVRGISHDGTETLYGSWSKVLKVPTSMKQQVKKLKVQKIKQQEIKISWAKVQKPKGAKKVYYDVMINGIDVKSYETDKTSLTCKAYKGNNIVTVRPYITTTGKMEWSKNEKKNMAYCFGKESEKKIKL